MRFSLLVFFFASALSFGTLTAFDSGILPAAPGPEGADGTLYYKTYASPVNTVRPIKRCVLQHGYGFTKRSLGVIRGTEPLLGPKENALFPRLRNLLPKSPEGTPLLQELLPFELFDAVANSYFGESLLNSLRSQVCDEVIVVARETVQTTIHEITLQTERFLKEKCSVKARPGQKVCAFIGHSKSGAVATSIARRCMEGALGQSELGEIGCRNLAEVYSIAGVNLGTGISAILLGAKVSGETGVVTGLADVLGAGASLVLQQSNLVGMDLQGDATATTNPAWLDLSPVAPLENQNSLFDTNRNLVLLRQGWWTGDYAASAGGKVYRGDVAEEISGGTRAAASLLTNPLEAAKTVGYRLFSSSVGSVHLNALERIYQIGMAEFENRSRSFSEGHPEHSWKNYQESDGVVERVSALKPCLNGLGKKDSSVTSCRWFPNLHHLSIAGSATESAEDILSQLKSKSN
jgi:hypothetical protein